MRASSTHGARDCRDAYIERVAAEVRRACELRRVLRAPSVSPVAAVIASSCVIAVVGCVDGDLSGAVGSIPGVVAALAIAIRAQSRIRIADAERERIAAISHAEAVEAVAEVVRGLRADLDTAGNVAREAIARERACEERLRTVDARCDALAAELAELRRSILSGHARGGAA